MGSGEIGELSLVLWVDQTIDGPAASARGGFVDAGTLRLPCPLNDALDAARAGAPHADAFHLGNVRLPADGTGWTMLLAAWEGRHVLLVEKDGTDPSSPQAPWQGAVATDVIPDAQKRGWSVVIDCFAASIPDEEDTPDVSVEETPGEGAAPDMAPTTQQDHNAATRLGGDTTEHTRSDSWWTRVSTQPAAGRLPHRAPFQAILDCLLHRHLGLHLALLPHPNHQMPPAQHLHCCHLPTPHRCYTATWHVLAPAVG